jgi:mannose-6-phosphate isomerase-like protein (cupin superfamily)
LRSLFFVCIFLIAGRSAAAQTIFHLQEVVVPEDAGNIYVQKLSEDTLTSSYFIQVRDTVRRHYHAHHTEQIFVLEGSGIMFIGTENHEIQAVRSTGNVPLQVLSIQSPFFDGKDRIFTDE